MSTKKLVKSSKHLVYTKLHVVEKCLATDTESTEQNEPTKERAMAPQIQLVFCDSDKLSQLHQHHWKCLIVSPVCDQPKSRQLGDDTEPNCQN